MCFLQNLLLEGGVVVFFGSLKVLVVVCRRVPQICGIQKGFRVRWWFFGCVSFIKGYTLKKVAFGMVSRV